MCQFPSSCRVLLIWASLSWANGEYIVQDIVGVNNNFGFPCGHDVPCKYFNNFFDTKWETFDRVSTLTAHTAKQYYHNMTGHPCFNPDETPIAVNITIREMFSDSRSSFLKIGGHHDRYGFVNDNFFSQCTEGPHSHTLQFIGNETRLFKNGHFRVDFYESGDAIALDYSLVTAVYNGTCTPDPAVEPIDLNRCESNNNFQKDLDYQFEPVLIVGEEVNVLPDPPSLAQGVYSVTPPFPHGLSLNSTSGEISGTPTVITRPKVYTVSATLNVNSTDVAGVDELIFQVDPDCTRVPTHVPELLVEPEHLFPGRTRPDIVRMALQLSSKYESVTANFRGATTNCSRFPRPERHCPVTYWTKRDVPAHCLKYYIFEIPWVEFANKAAMISRNDHSDAMHVHFEGVLEVETVENLANSVGDTVEKMTLVSELPFIIAYPRVPRMLYVAESQTSLGLVANASFMIGANEINYHGHAINSAHPVISSAFVEGHLRIRTEVPWPFMLDPSLATLSVSSNLLSDLSIETYFGTNSHATRQRKHSQPSLPVQPGKHRMPHLLSQNRMDQSSLAERTISTGKLLAHWTGVSERVSLEEHVDTFTLPDVVLYSGRRKASPPNFTRPLSTPSRSWKAHNCRDANSSCTQQWDIKIRPICCSLNGFYKIGMQLACRDSNSTRCGLLHGNGTSDYTFGFSLTSNNLCPRVMPDIDLSASVTSYADADYHHLKKDFSSDDTVYFKIEADSGRASIEDVHFVDISVVAPELSSTLFTRNLRHGAITVGRWDHVSMESHLKLALDPSWFNQEKHLFDLEIVIQLEVDYQRNLTKSNNKNMIRKHTKRTRKLNPSLRQQFVTVKGSIVVYSGAKPIPFVPPHKTGATHASGGMGTAAVLLVSVAVVAIFSVTLVAVWRKVGVYRQQRQFNRLQGEQEVGRPGSGDIRLTEPLSRQ
eukprot:82462_1